MASTAQRMNSSRRVGWLVIAIVIAAVLAVAIGGWSLTSTYFTRSTESGIDVVALIPLTGAGATTGIDIQDALVLAQEQINERHPGEYIRLTIMDSETDVNVARERFAEIAAMTEVDVVISSTSLIGNAIAPDAESAHIPLIGITTTDPAVTEGRQWAFRYWPTASEQVAPYEAVFEREGIESVLLVIQDDGFGRATDAAMRALTDRLNMRYDVIINPLGTETATEARDRAGEFDAVYVGGFAGFQNPVVETLLDGYEGQLIVGYGLTDATERANIGDRALYTAVPLILNDDFVFAREAQQAFQERYGRRMGQSPAAAYDVLFLLESLTNGSDADAGFVQRELRGGFTYPSIFGSIHVTSGQQDISYPIHALKFTADTLEYVF